MSETKKINALKARQNFGELLNKVFYNKEEVVIQRAGKEMAVIISIENYKKWKEGKEKLTKALKEVTKQLDS